MLVLGLRGVAYAYGTGVRVAGQVIEFLLGRWRFTADAVHDLQIFGLGRAFEQEVIEVSSFPLVSEVVYPLQGERRVPGPAESVVVVPGAADGLR